MFSFETVFVDEKGKIDRHEQHQTECLSIELGNGVNLELVYIPGGSFGWIDVCSSASTFMSHSKADFPLS